MTRKQRRLAFIGVVGVVLLAAAGLMGYALRDSISLFMSPSDIVAQHPGPGTRLRMGGLVKEGSVVRDAGTTVRFEVTDGAATVPVTYTGILPDLFREKQGVVTEGTMQPGGTFKADTVLAKHDEKYMPKEVVDALKASGEWQRNEANR